MLARRIVMRNS
uniref:Uncharacterized protein n=1 Tax=Plectus sambesii TaxID=2011161 RepID=A0A914W0P6_9BILA